MNKIILIGRLTRDVELRYSTTGQAVAKYSLAVNRDYHKDGEPDTDFFNVVSFGKAAEFADKYFKKGRQVAVVGELNFETYTNKDGQKVYTHSVKASEQHFADSKQDSADKPAAQAKTSVDANADYGGEADLPF